MSEKLKDITGSLFSLLTKASARKKVYAQKAAQGEQEELGHLLRVLSHSESIQARRILNLIKGKIDTSDQYVATIFEDEIEEVVDGYAGALLLAQKEEDKVFTLALSQLKAAEVRARSFYSKKTKSIKNEQRQEYFVCQFCGYIHTENIPEQCPICGAAKSGFKEVG